MVDKLKSQILSEETFSVSPYSFFVYSIRSPVTKECYLRRLRIFLDFIGFECGKSMEDRCNAFVEKGKSDIEWIFASIVRFLQYQKERAQRKEITGGTLSNYVKTIKSFCEITDLLIPWKKITRGLPRGRRYADDRAPTLEEIKKIVEYPDRRIKPVIYIMLSSGIRVGAWDYLKWRHFSPIIQDNKVVAAKVIVYADEDEEYFTFCTAEAFFSLKAWMDYRQQCGEYISEESWVMRNLWDTTNPRMKGDIVSPRKLTSVGVKRLVERSLWAQGIRSNLPKGKRRHEFQCDHGFRKAFRTQCELAGLKVSNIEILLNQSLGISDSYYKVTETQLLQDYLKAADNFLTLSNESRMQKKVADLEERAQRDANRIEFGLKEKEEEIRQLMQRDETSADAIISLSDKLNELTDELQKLKQKMK